ncbi:unnamed protein product [Adineta steineri]|uniref:Uncharacterized protein n=1 Tax=Adineta steineri TaxID=433720 RepID=A0A818HAW6_9BILA|nr:unnamed protein product [Adineta steineri]CAF3503411.1 unnamed protein product [Adineta steineri]
MKLIFYFNLLNCFYVLIKSNEYFLDTCCSLNENQRIYLSCGLNEKIHLNLIEIFYNSEEYCSEQFYCCKYKTKCSRRITKYSSLHCDQQNSCWIDKTCLKIYKPCTNIYGLYGQYITINYTCLPSNNNNEDDYYHFNETNDETIPFIVKLLTSQEDSSNKKNSLIKNEIFLSDNLKSSPILLILIICIFIFLMLFTYWLAYLCGKNICRKNSNKTKTTPQKLLIPQKIQIKHENNNKIKVQSNQNSLPQTRIYPSYQYNNNNNQQHHRERYYPTKSRHLSYSYNPHRQYISVQHDPLTGQISSRTFNSYLNYY